MTTYCKQCNKVIYTRIILGCICGSFCSNKCMNEYHATKFEDRTDYINTGYVEEEQEI